MVDFDRLITRFRQFSGWRLVWQYVRMGCCGRCLDTLCLEGEKLITPFEGVKMIRNGKRYK